MSDPSIELRLMASAHWLRKSSDKTMKLAADLQDEAAARIRELEMELKARDFAITALAGELNEAYDRGVREGIEQVRHQIHEMRLHKSTNAEDACDRATAWFKTEGGGA